LNVINEIFFIYREITSYCYIISKRHIKKRESVVDGLHYLYFTSRLDLNYLILLQHKFITVWFSFFFLFFFYLKDMHFVPKKYILIRSNRKEIGLC